MGPVFEFLRRLARTVLGVVGLIGFAIELRGRLRGRYAAWRSETAFGPRPPCAKAAAREALAFGRWRARMRRHS